MNNIARVYASALMDVSRESGDSESLHGELNFIAALLSDEKDFGAYMASPRFSKEEKKGFVKKVFSEHLSEHIVNFLNVLIENGRQNELQNISAAFDDLMDDLNNRMKVEVVSVSELNENALENIRSVLKQRFGKDITVKERADTSILGGIIIKAGDLVIDGSLAENLKRIRDDLLNSRVRSEVAYEN